jgi:NAD(P)-dependent dehydrogenase (short-subunit alcohol dehydrogenase family)
MGEVALVTGANKGIGHEIARRLGVLGMTVFLGARDERRGAQAAASLGGGARPIVLDVTRPETAQAAAETIERESGRLDVLVNNAGVLLDTERDGRSDLDLLRATYETNVFGTVTVTRAMLALLRRSPAGRIVNVSSHLGSLAKGSDPAFKAYTVKHLAYNTSKTALNAVTVHFAYELRGTAIKVNAAAPGPVATGLGGGIRSPRGVEQGAEIAVRLATLPDDGPSGGFFDEEGTVPW